MSQRGRFAVVLLGLVLLLEIMGAVVGWFGLPGGWAGVRDACLIIVPLTLLGSAMMIGLTLLAFNWVHRD
jgi:hypothetical protein